MAIVEIEVIAFAHLDLIGQVKHHRAADELADGALAAAGVAAEGSANGAGDSRQDLEPRQARPRGLRDQRGQRHGRPCLHHIFSHDDVGERRALELNDAAH